MYPFDEKKKCMKNLEKINENNILIINDIRKQNLNKSHNDKVLKNEMKKESLFNQNQKMLCSVEITPKKNKKIRTIY